MKTRTAKLALTVVILVMSVSGCASLSLQPGANTEIPLNSKASSLEMQFGMARLLERNGKLEQARKAYLKILSHQSHNPSLHRLGVTAIRQNRLDAGLQHLSEAAKSESQNVELLGDLGYAQFLGGDLSAAETTLKKAVMLDPSQKRNVNNLAIVVGKQNRLNESFQLFRQANAEAEALANLAFIQAQSSDFGKAQANYNRALDLDPKLRIAAVGLMEVHKHIKTSPEPGAERIYDRELDRVIEPMQQQRLPERIATALPTRTQASPSSSSRATNRVIANFQRPLQLPGRAPASNTQVKNTPKQIAEKLGAGMFQPPSFSSSESKGTVAQVSYQESIIDQSPPN